MLNIKVGKNGWIGDILVSLSIANLMLLESFNYLIYSPASELYYLPLHTWHHYLSSIILLVLLLFIIFLPIRLLRANLHLVWKILSFALIIFILFVTAKSILDILELRHIPEFFETNTVWALLLIIGSLINIFNS